MNFSERLVRELSNRGWSRSEAARRGGISSSMFDKVINGYASPGIKFLKGLAQAFDLPLAEIISWLDSSELNENTDWEIWKDMLSQFTPENRQRFRRIMETEIEYQTQQKSTRKRG